MTRRIIGLLAVVAAIGLAAFWGYRDGHHHEVASHQSN
jgi:hypothetical protein